MQTMLKFCNNFNFLTQKMNQIFIFVTSSLIRLINIANSRVIQNFLQLFIRLVASRKKNKQNLHEIAFLKFLAFLTKFSRQSRMSSPRAAFSEDSPHGEMKFFALIAIPFEF